MRFEYPFIVSWHGDNREQLISGMEKKFGVATLVVAEKENRYYGFDQDGLMVCEAYFTPSHLVVFQTTKQVLQ